MNITFVNAWLFEKPITDVYGRKHDVLLKRNNRTPDNAEPLYTLPNALRALAADDEMVCRLIGLSETRNGMRDTPLGLRKLAEELEAGPIPEEPTNGEVVETKNGDIHKRRFDGKWTREGLTWTDYVRRYGPVTIYERKNS